MPNTPASTPTPRDSVSAGLGQQQEDEKQAGACVVEKLITLHETKNMATFFLATGWRHWI